MELLGNDCSLRQRFEVADHSYLADSLKEHFHNLEEVIIIIIIILAYFDKYFNHMTSNHAFANEHMAEEKAPFDVSNLSSSLVQL